MRLRQHRQFLSLSSSHQVHLNGGKGVDVCISFLSAILLLVLLSHPNHNNNTVFSFVPTPTIATILRSHQTTALRFVHDIAMLPRTSTTTTTMTKLQQAVGDTDINVEKVPSWEELSDITKCNEHEQPIAVNGADYSSHPSFEDNTKPILYRERHGWCPYSERVWLALEVFNVDYNTIYIDNIYGRPTWYSGDTPQMKWPDGKTQSESMDLVRAINTRYGSGSSSDTNSKNNIDLYPPDIVNDVVNKIRAFQNIFPKQCRPSSRAAFLFRYDGEPLWKNEFEIVLEKTNELLAPSNKQDDGPFFCGSRFTAADIAWVPFLERYAGQLPSLHDGLNPKNYRQYPHLAKWYTAMETSSSIAVYGCKLRGDHSSWRKVLTMAGFGNAGNVPDVTLSRMEKLAQQECQPISLELQQQQQLLWEHYITSTTSKSTNRQYLASSPNKEAAAVLIRNRLSIVKDIFKRSKNTTTVLPANNRDEMYKIMRSLAYLLCNYDDVTKDDGSDGSESTLLQQCKNDVQVQALASYLNDRMAVPRDMGAVSAGYFKRIM